MTCKDCIHYDVCVIVEHQTGEDEDYLTEFGCSDFKPKSRFIELPCAVGDYVEWDNNLGVKTLYRVKGYMCDSVGFRFILDDFSPVVNHENITRILTKEEAEKALERSEGKNV